MANEVTTSGDPRDADDNRGAVAVRQPTEPMFQGRRDLGAGAAVGAIAIESERAIAEAQASMVVAQRFPRDENEAYARMMQVCLRLSFCQQAFYSYSRGGQTVEGPSIRMAEELARCWRNFDYGMLELNQHDGSSEYQAFAHDKETNVRTYQNFTVNHIRDTKSGGKALTDQRDVYEIGANMGSRRMRARILALLPAWYVDDAVQACKKTLADRDAKIPLADQIRAMAAYALTIGVTTEMLELKLGHALASTQPAEIATLRGVFTALKEGVTTIIDEFPTGEPKADGGLAPAKPEPKPKTQAKPAETPKPAEEPKAAETPPAQSQAQTPPAEAQQQPAQEKPQEAAEPAAGAQAAGEGEAPTGEASGAAPGKDLF